MSVTMALTKGAVSSAGALASRTPTTVRSAPSRRRIETVVQRLSTWGVPRRISSMNAKNTASRRGDRWAPSSPRPAGAAARTTPTIASREGASQRVPRIACPHPGAWPLCPPHPDPWIDMHRIVRPTLGHDECGVFWKAGGEARPPSSIGSLWHHGP